MAIETPDAQPARRRSPIAAAVLSFVFPGAGQLYLGRRVAALAFALPAAAAVAWAAYQLRDPAYFAASLLDSGYALTVMAVVAAVTLLRVAAIAHPFVVSRPRRLGARAGVTLVALVVASIVMAYPVYSNAADFYALPNRIADNGYVDATDSPDPSASPEIVASETPAPTDEATDEPEPTDTPEFTPSPGWTCPPSYSKISFGGGSAVAAAVGVPAQPLHLVLADATSSIEPSVSSSPSDGASPSSSAGSSSSPSATPSATPTATPSVGPTPTPTPTPIVTPRPNARRLTIVLIGLDFISGRNHSLTDSLMLVSVNLDTKAVAMVSVPRDTANFPYYWGGSAPVSFKINRLAKSVASGSVHSPDSPMVTLANEVGFLVGVKVNYYAAIDMAGFRDLVDLVGGVNISNPRALNDPFTCTVVPKGPVHLDGSQALRYVRSRESTNDYYRAGRQQIVMMALRAKLATPAILPQLGSLLEVAGKSIATNFPLKNAKDYVDLAQHVTTISHCVLGPPYNYHPPSSTTGGSWTSRLKLDRVANLSEYLFGKDSRYHGLPGVAAASCQNRY